jgi:O-antigen/teichoic acid export membrane protein
VEDRAEPGPREPARSAGERALKNTAARAGGEVVGKIATFVLFAALARSTGESGFGAFVFALAYLELVLVPVGLGCDFYLVREVARDRSALNRLFFQVLGLKLALAGPVLGTGFLILTLAGYEGRVRETVSVLAVGLLLDLLSRSLQAVFNAFERSELLALSLMVQRVTTMALGVTALSMGYGVVTVAAIYSLGAAIGLASGVALVVTRVGLPRFRISPRGWPRLARTSLPFAVQDALGTLLFRLDALMLSAIAGQAALGRYGAAYRLLESTAFVGWALNGAFAAMFVYLGNDTEPTLRAVFGRALKLALALLVPVAVPMALLAEPLATLIYGSDFEEAAKPMLLLAPVVVILPLVALGSSLIISRRGPRVMLRVTGVMVVLNVILNALLIPSLEDQGAAIAMLATEAAFLVAALRLAVPEAGGVGWMRTLAAPVSAGMAMTVAVLALRASPVSALIAGLVAYGVVLVSVERVVSPADLRFVTGTVRRWLPSRLAA